MERLAIPRRLERLYNRTTCYEAGLIGPDGRQAARLGFYARKTRQSLLQCAFAHGLDIGRISGAPSDSSAVWKGGAWQIGATGWRIAWTGKTERDCACEELDARA